MFDVLSRVKRVGACGVREACALEGIELAIVFSPSDCAIVLPLIEALRKRGHTVWSHADIAADAPFETTTEAALHRARKVMVAWSKASVENSAIAAQATRALREDKLVQVYLEPCAAPMFLAERQGIDLRPAIKDGTDQPLLALFAELEGRPPIADLALWKRRWLRRTLKGGAIALFVGTLAWLTFPVSWRFWARPSATPVAISVPTHSLTDTLGRRVSDVTAETPFLLAVPFTTLSNCSDEILNNAYKMQQFVNVFLKRPGHFLLVDFSEDRDLDDQKVQRLTELLGPRFSIVTRRSSGDPTVIRAMRELRAFFQRISPIRDGDLPSYDHTGLAYLFEGNGKYSNHFQMHNGPDSIDMAGKLLYGVFQKHADAFTPEAHTRLAAASGLLGWDQGTFKTAVASLASSSGGAQFAALDLGRPLKRCG